jgi:hypothetical protein
MSKTIVVIILALLFIFTAIYCYHYFGGYEGVGDGNDYAGLARNILHGQGFSLGHLYPLALAFDSRIPQPNNIWAPGYPLYLTLWFVLLGANDNAAIFASIFAVWLLIISAYMLGRHIIGDKYALLAAALIGLSQIVLFSAVEGTPEILSGALLTFSIIIILKSQNAFRIFISGILFATAALTRYQIVIVGVPLSILFIDNKRHFLPLWIAGVLLGTAPWLMRNMIVLGNPIFTLQSYGEYTKGMGRFDDYYYTYRSFTPMTLWYTLSHFPFDLAKKFVAGIIFLAGAFPLRFNFLGIIPFFFAALKIGQIEGVQKKLVLFAFISSLLIILLSALDGHHDRHLVPLQPVFAITTLIGFVLLAKSFRFFESRPVMIALGMLLFIPARLPLQELMLSRTAQESRFNAAVYSEISRIVKPGDVVISDASDAIWWYANRPAIWIPVHYDDIRSLFARDDCRYLYLANPIDFMNKLNDDQIANFAMSTELIPNLPGNGRLYRLIKFQSRRSNEEI